MSPTRAAFLRGITVGAFVVVEHAEGVKGKRWRLGTVTEVSTTQVRVQVGSTVQRYRIRDGYEVGTDWYQAPHLIEATPANVARAARSTAKARAIVAAEALLRALERDELDTHGMQAAREACQGVLDRLTPDGTLVRS